MKTPAAPPATGSQGLLPALGVFSATMMVAGGVIGSGIFRKPGIMAAQVGSPELLLAVWLVAGVISLLGSLSNAELAAMMPRTGGQFVFLERAYGSFVAFLYGWALLAVIQSGSIAALVYVFAEYATQFVTLKELTGPWAEWRCHLPLIGDVVPFENLGLKSAGTVVIAVLTIINYIGVRFGGMVQNVFSVAKMAAMVGLTVAVLLAPGSGSMANLTTPSLSIHPAGLAWWAAVVAALQGAFWAYDGWQKVTYIAGELKAPQRDLPRSLILGILLVTLLYLVLSAVYAYVLPIDQMAQSKLVAADVAERCVRGGGRWIAVAVMLSTFGAANATILTSARVYFSMARDGMLPAALSRVQPRFHTPGAALVVQAVWSILLLFSGTFDTLTDTLIFVSWFFYAANAWAVVVLRQREPDTPRPFKVPGYPWVPLTFVTFGIVYLLLTLYNDVAAYRQATAAGRPALLNCALGAALVFSGAPVYFWFRLRRSAPA